MAKDALIAGYRHIDTAEGYGTEAELGQALKESNIPREDLFIATKVVQTITEGKIEDLPTALENSLKRLQLDYVDLWATHNARHFIWSLADALQIPPPQSLSHRRQVCRGRRRQGLETAGGRPAHRQGQGNRHLQLPPAARREPAQDG